MCSLANNSGHNSTFNNTKHFACNNILLLFNGLFSRTTWISQHQKGKPFWILLQQEMMVCQWHQLDHMQIICTSLQTDNHARTSPLSFTCPIPLLLPNQQCQNTEEVKQSKIMCELKLKIK